MDNIELQKLAKDYLEKENVWSSNDAMTIVLESHVKFAQHLVDKGQLTGINVGQSSEDKYKYLLSIQDNNSLTWSDLPEGQKPVKMKKTAEEIYNRCNSYDNRFKSFKDIALESMEQHKDQHTAPLIEALEEAKKSKWIPVTERLPENRSYVVISYWSGYDVAEYKHGCFFIGLSRITGVKYWMPLEAPETALLNAKS